MEYEHQRKRSIDSLERDLSCPICFSEAFSSDTPILTCENNHLMCTSCTDKIKICPFCRKPSGTTRNTLAENILQFLRKASLMLNENYSIETIQVSPELTSFLSNNASTTFNFITVQNKRLSSEVPSEVEVLSHLDQSSEEDLMEDFPDNISNEPSLVQEEPNKAVQKAQKYSKKIRKLKKFFSKILYSLLAVF